MKLVYRNPDDAFPLHIRGSRAEVEGQIKAWEQVPANVKAAYETQVQGLLYGLNERNQSLMMTFRCVYIVYTADPCANAEFLKRRVEKMTEDDNNSLLLTISVHGLIELISAHPQPHDQVLALYGEIVQRLYGVSDRLAATAEIEETRQVAKRWIRGQD